ncbi:hypothetical protein OD507_005421 [Salmonella enterica]|nr:hypothetical protein [Salmonella enterica]EJU2684808.1 hypothetical protein [Salmonella enterica]EJX3842868.1 hypothetical protein [Salmonella enterica]EJX4248846.1 hypothetical protein [Salmonella enterica]EJX4537680.1 hypothetical protein [Salmonella enterica]
MRPELFIKKHITDALLREGFSELVAQGGAIAGLDHYRRMSQASRKGKAFDDCYFYARQWALGQTTKIERKTKKKPGRGASPGLF